MKANLMSRLASAGLTNPMEPQSQAPRALKVSVSNLVGGKVLQKAGVSSAQEPTRPLAVTGGRVLAPLLPLQVGQDEGKWQRPLETPKTHLWAPLPLVAPIQATRLRRTMVQGPPPHLCWPVREEAWSYPGVSRGNRAKSWCLTCVTCWWGSGWMGSRAGGL